MNTVNSGPRNFAGVRRPNFRKIGILFATFPVPLTLSFWLPVPAPAAL